MIKKILCSILMTLLHATNVFASNVSAEITVYNNTAKIILSGIDKNIHALQIDLIDKNANTNIIFAPIDSFSYNKVLEKQQNGQTVISIVLDNKNKPLTTNGTLNVGILSFTGKPNLSETLQIELVDLNESLEGKKATVVANINIEDSGDSGDNGNNGSGSGNGNNGGGVEIGSTTTSTTTTTTTEPTTETTTQNVGEKDQNKPTLVTNPDGSINIDAMYPVIKEVEFKDTANHWANEPIKYLADRGIINGTGEGTFEPNDKITRAQFITLLAKMDNINIDKYKTTSFKDVPEDAWFNPYVDWATEAGITSGIGDGNFAPNSNITREQMAVMIERFCQYKNFKLESNKQPVTFSDDNNISSYAKDAVAKVQQAGIINGRTDGSFAPKANATRAESAQMIYTMLTIQ